MSGYKKTKAELVAIYRLEFYRKQKNWKLSSDVRRNQKDKEAAKTSLNETYNLDQKEEDDPGDTLDPVAALDPAEALDAGDTGDSHSAHNRAFTESDLGKTTPPVESPPNTTHSWPENDPNLTQGEWPAESVEHIPTPPPYPLKPVETAIWAHWEPKVAQNWSKEKSPELNCSYTKVDWTDSERYQVKSSQEWKPQHWAGSQPWSEAASSWDQQLAQQLDKHLALGLDQQMDQQLDQRLRQQLDQKLDQQLSQQLDQRLRQQLAPGLEQQLDQQLNQQLDQRLRQQLAPGLDQQLAQGLDLPELDQVGGEGGEDTWWDIPCGTGAVWSEAVVRELASLEARAGGGGDQLLRWMRAQGATETTTALPHSPSPRTPAPAPASAPLPRPDSPSPADNSSYAKFLRGAHCGPHSSELDLTAYTDSVGQDEPSSPLWSLPGAALEERGLRLLQSLRRVSSELAARYRIQHQQRSGVSSDVEPTRDVGLWGSPGDAVLAGSHLRGRPGTGGGQTEYLGDIDIEDVGIDGNNNQRISQLGRPGSGQFIGRCPPGFEGNQCIDVGIDGNNNQYTNIGLDGGQYFADIGLNVPDTGLGRGPQMANMEGILHPSTLQSGLFDRTLPSRGRGRLPRPVDPAGRPPRSRGRC